MICFLRKRARIICETMRNIDILIFLLNPKTRRIRLVVLKAMTLQQKYVSPLTQ